MRFVLMLLLVLFGCFHATQALDEIPEQGYPLDQGLEPHIAKIKDIDYLLLITHISTVRNDEVCGLRFNPKAAYKWGQTRCVLLADLSDVNFPAGSAIKSLDMLPPIQKNISHYDGWWYQDIWRGYFPKAFLSIKHLTNGKTRFTASDKKSLKDPLLFDVTCPSEETGLYTIDQQTHVCTAGYVPHENTPEKCITYVYMLDAYIYLEHAGRCFDRGDTKYEGAFVKFRH